MLRFLRLAALVTLDDPEPTLARARQAAATGDESWQRWLTEYERGEALIVRLELTLEVSDGNREVLRIANPGVFVEKHPDPPKVEQQIAEIAGKDFSLLAGELSARGHEIDEGELDELYVHVELEQDLTRALSPPESSVRRAHSGPPDAEVRLSRPETP